MMNTILVVATVTIPATALGFLLGRLVGHEILGTVAGIVIGLLLGLYGVTRRRRWIASAGLILLIALSFVAGGWWGTAYAFAVSGVTFFISAAILRELYGGNEFRALSHHLRLAIGVIRAFQVIRDGAIVSPSGSGPLLGPHLTIIGPHNAVIMERGSEQTRISGPAVFTSMPFEYVKQIYDLRQRKKSLTFEDVLTSDLTPTTVSLSVTYGINIPTRARKGQMQWTHAHARTIGQIDSWMPNWERSTEEAIECGVRQSVATMALTPLLTPGNLSTLERQILQLTNRRMRPWSITMQQVIVNSVQPQPAVKEATTSRWIADTETKTTVTIERARAQAWREALELLADGYRVATQMGMSEAAIHREVLRRTLEQMAKDPATKVIFTPEVNSALAGLLRAVGLLAGDARAD